MLYHFISMPWFVSPRTTLIALRAWLFSYFIPYFIYTVHLSPRVPAGFPLIRTSAGRR